MAVERISSGMLTKLSQDALGVPRRRNHVNLHKSYSEPCQRLFNAISIDSYIRPHRHLLDPKDELLIAVRGVFALFVFDDVGDVIDMITFGSEVYQTEPGVDSGVIVKKGAWHTVIALVSGSVLFEVKDGPFVEASAKEFAEWSPKEDAEGVQEYLCWMHSLVRIMSLEII